MKLKFLIDDENPNRWGVDDVCNDMNESGSNVYVQSRHKHERKTFWEVFYDLAGARCSHNDKEFSTVLIDIPDDIMFQYMVEGINDNDYLVYNLYTEKLVVGNCLYTAGTLAYSTSGHSHSQSTGRAMRGMGRQNNASLMFDWYPERENESTAKEIVFDIQDTFYNLVYSAIKPYIEHWFCLNFKMTSRLFMDLKGEYIDDGEDYPVAEASSRYNISTDEVRFIFDQYIEDGYWYKAIEKNLTLNDIEPYRNFYLHIWKLITEVQDEKNGTNK